ncbi:hypothetical protein GQ600_25353 [Phytophthora cactorum]|nr:hypothetical protein GQ600_25353 [Phytophthora cactorum]
MNTSFRESASSLSDAASAAQNELWEVDLSASSAFSTVSIPSSVQPKKKRIRRQKQELLYLRELVVNLEEQMSKLKVKQPPSIDDHDKAAIEGENSSEEKNHNLRSSLEGQLKLARKLEGLLHKRPRDEVCINWEEAEILTDPKRFKPLASTSLSPTDDEIFAHQMAHVQRASLEVDRIFDAAEFADQVASFNNLHVMNDSNSDAGVAFVKKASSLIPFDIKVTEKAMWRALAEEGIKKDRYFLDERLTTDNVVVSSYGLHFRAGTFHANVLGKQTYRKYVVDDRVVITWKWVVDPMEVNGTKFCGIRCHETGWIVLRGVNIGTSSTFPTFSSIPSNSVTSTKLQSYSKMTMELQDDITNQDLQVGALTNFVVNMHDTITEVCGKMITDVLVEEDWNVNAGDADDADYDQTGEDGDHPVNVKTETSIWKGIAERQQTERARAEEKNQKLRASLEGQLKLATKLERLLRKRPRDEEVAELAGYKRYKPLAVAPTDFANRAASFCDLQVTSDSGSDTGVAFVTKAYSMLPFDVHVAERAFWRAFAEEGPSKMSYFNEERLATENLCARKQTYRKYVDNDCVMLLWKAHTEPIEINGVKLSGLCCNQVGWIVLRGVNLAPDDAQSGLLGISKTMMSTSLQSYCKMTLELQEDIADQELQVGALTNFVVNSHDAITDICGSS